VGPDLATAGDAIVRRANAFRQTQGLAPVAPSAALSAAAAGFAAFMARTDRYGHEADGHEPAQRAEAQGYRWCLVAENIAYVMSSAGFGTAELAERFVQGWIDSPGHRRNLLEPDATETGVGVAHSASSDRYYAVQMFGRPASLRLRFQISNRSGTAIAYEVGDQRYTLAPQATRRHEQCSTATLRIALPDAAPALQAVRDGARFRIEGAGRGWRLAEE
jgi:hypothetical protein